MEKEHIKSAANKLVGSAKEKAGEMMDEKKLQAEGKTQKAKGQIQEKIAEAKDAVD